MIETDDDRKMEKYQAHQTLKLQIFYFLVAFFFCLPAQSATAEPNHVEVETPVLDSVSVLVQDKGVNSIETKTGSEQEEETFQQLYSEAVKAYESQLWYSCKTKMEKALKGYNYYKSALSTCRLACREDSSSSKLTNLTSGVNNFEVFGSILKTADCLRRCADNSLGGKHKGISERLQEAFESRVPYQYLQFCYYKLEQPENAASAAYTYYLANPEDEDSKRNIIYYRDKALVPEEQFVDMEMVPYKEHYIRGILAYSEEDWTTAVSNLEMCLNLFYPAHRQCMVDCEAKQDVTGSEFSTAVADWMIRILICQLSCEEQLSIVYTEPIELFLQDIYNHLQFAAYQVEDYEKCVEATASFLALNASHDVMRANKELLIELKGFTEKDFKSRQEVADFASNKKEMQDLMDAINRNYRWPDNVQQLPDEDDDKDLYSNIYELGHQLTVQDDWMSRYEQLGMHLIATSTELLKEERFVSDGLLRSDQCDGLQYLTQELKRGPFGSSVFTLDLAKQWLEQNPSEELEASLRLLIRAAEVVRHYTQRYLNPEISYYIKKTSIVCWSPLEDSEEALTCLPQEDGTCLKFDKLSDELYSDLYTTVTYLNAVDEDGDFLFLNEDKGTDSSLGVKCGRTIGFNTGDRHSLKVPKLGESKRCAMVLRYTTEKYDDEREYRDMMALLHRIDEIRWKSRSQSPSEVMKTFAEQGVKIVRESKELRGPERFVADNIASETQCSTLRNMVLSAALTGDGYDHLRSKKSEISPHTEHELFRGLTMFRASKLAQHDLVSTGALRNFLDLSEDSRLFVEKYFNLTRPLYFDYTHLVCRTARDETKTKREDLSHPVHADNCNLQPNGSCSKDYPAFTQRDYSAILYLNDDFEGGEFFFAHSNKSEQMTVRPKCGRLVGFNASSFHGVKAVRKGERCALALWFTHNANFKQLGQVYARKILKQKEGEEKHVQSGRREDL